jgi:hypothetical protein
MANITQQTLEKTLIALEWAATEVECDCKDQDCTGSCLLFACEEAAALLRHELDHIE